MRVAIGSDHAGFALKTSIHSLLVDELGVEVVDTGCTDCQNGKSVDYPDYALPVARMVARGEVDRGILICGTGIGMSIAANKIKGIRAALVHDLFTARAAREHNDANVLALGGRLIGPDIAREIVRLFITTPYSGGRHDRRLDKIAQIEQSHASP
ncbi:ribose 5-phosphate isomerase B [Kyrpidia spormannii]|uniref:Ribose 5-phosphate isomerase n=2 Tax=Kyrpidia spormannii TaxID=2055160 RepID=A0ACA8ZCD5_9BACL|nr:ribose 5-phosphate isomerase B [Kyrpidia spormannii]CAB3394934.1 ribose 5-phosphate isomerase [Kyrpidia spormannii]CAB3395898.1 D-ribose 5-phosphate epimerase (promiscuous) [Kyrpidia spormannii]